MKLIFCMSWINIEEDKMWLILFYLYSILLSLFIIKIRLSYIVGLVVYNIYEKYRLELKRALRSFKNYFCVAYSEGE